MRQLTVLLTVSLLIAAMAGLAEPMHDRWDEAGLGAADLLPGAVLDVTWAGRRVGVLLDVPALVLLANGGQLLELADDGTAALDDDGLPVCTFEHPATVAALGTEVEDVVVLPLPQADRNERPTVLGGSSLVLPVGGDQHDLAFELMLALTGSEVGVYLAATESRPPALRAAHDDPRFTSRPDLAVFVEQLEYANVVSLTAFPEVSIAFRDALEAVLGQRPTPAEAMIQVQHVAERWRAMR